MTELTQSVMPKKTFFMDQNKTDKTEYAENNYQGQHTNEYQPIGQKRRVLQYWENTMNGVCPHCKEKHYLDHCPDFIAIDIEKRQFLVKKLKPCNNCFKTIKQFMGFAGVFVIKWYVPKSIIDYYI